ncbi:SDR family NAD(P)-dependent oxidoreductase [Roseomonas populi]|uniref:SDR family oxidoreductase n=1 Tax=Roseomonas populi TaxID=3121582 RepID=A0ABT1XC14_9PROT|nr:SDR family oxidoreductase [Roseomonas pecuniae]MCR0985662.1 SDR family oxidoreductase [Roseomonas pecuniae]
MDAPAVNRTPRTEDASRQVHPETLGQGPRFRRLAGRRVLVVGAGQRASAEPEPPVGNGRAMAVLFAREGASVACLDNARDALMETCAIIGREGGVAVPILADVSDAGAIPRAVEEARENLGGLDGLVLNVGISTRQKMDELTTEDWDRVFAVNVRSNMLFAQQALRVMAPGGAIVLISSLASHRAASRNPAYEASKAAQVALARSIARAGEPMGIRCNSVAPGLMDTPMGRDASRNRPSRAAFVPFGRQGTGWEVAYAALFLISNEASYVNGHCLLVDGGLGVGIARD